MQYDLAKENEELKKDKEINAIVRAYAIVPSMYVLYMLGFISLLIIALTFVIFRRD